MKVEKPLGGINYILKEGDLVDVQGSTNGVHMVRSWTGLYYELVSIESGTRWTHAETLEELTKKLNHGSVIYSKDSFKLQIVPINQ